MSKKAERSLEKTYLQHGSKRVLRNMFPNVRETDQRVATFAVLSGKTLRQTRAADGLEAARNLVEPSTTRVVGRNARTLVMDGTGLGSLIVTVGRGRRRENGGEPGHGGSGKGKRR